MTAPNRSPARARPLPAGLAQLSSALIGAAGAMAVNLLSTDLGYRGVLAALLAGSVLAAAAWLRRLPPQAPIVRYAQRSLLSLALGCAVAAVAGPASWARPATVVAGCLTGMAVLVAASLYQVTRMLFGCATAGLGVAVGQVCGGALIRGQWLGALQTLPLAVGCLLACLAMAWNSYALRRAIFLSAFALYGTAALICFALGQLATALTYLPVIWIAAYFYDSTPKRGVRYREVSPGVGLVRADLAPGGAMPPWLGPMIDRRAALVIGFGLASLLGAVVAFISGVPLIGATLIVGGVGSVGRGGLLLRHGHVMRRVRERLRTLTHDPTEPHSPSTDVGQQGDPVAVDRALVSGRPAGTPSELDGTVVFGPPPW